MSGTQKQQKPALAGAKTKQRKSVQKAQAKHEPSVFRDTLIKHLESVPPGDFDGYASKLDTLGQTLDFRKYSQQLFELLLVGKLLAPGGNYVEDGANGSPFSVLTSAKYPIDMADMKKVVDVFHKLMRRYKYLQKLFEEQSLISILQYINKFDESTSAAAGSGSGSNGNSEPTSRSETPDNSNAPTPVASPGQAVAKPNQEKLAAATALFVSSGLVNGNVLDTLRKNHLVKDGTSLAFITVYFRYYLSQETPEHLAASLRRSGLDELLDFFPPNSNRNITELKKHFEANNLAPVVQFYNRLRSSHLRDQTLTHVKELVVERDEQEAATPNNKEIIEYLKEQSQQGSINDADFTSLCWEGMVSNLDMGARQDQLCEQAIKVIQAACPVFATFTSTAKSQIALANNVQIWCYENAKVMSLFPRILKVLYQEDVLSDQAILYWHSKGAKTQARQHFLKAAQPLVDFLRSQDSSDEEDSDEE